MIRSAVSCWDGLVGRAGGLVGGGEEDERRMRAGGMTRG